MFSNPEESDLSHQFYNVLHITGIVLIVTTLAGAAMYALAGGGSSERGPSRRTLAILHGLGALLVLVSGFGLLARLGVMHGAGFPGWVWAKLTVWFVLAAALFIPFRRPQLAALLFFALPVLGGLAAYLAIYKPF